MGTSHYTATMPRASIRFADGAAAPEPGPDLLALDRQVCFALAVASRTVVSLYRPLLEPMGLTHPQYLVMLALWESGPLRVSESPGGSAWSPPPSHPWSSGWRPVAW